MSEQPPNDDRASFRTKQQALQVVSNRVAVWLSATVGPDLFDYYDQLTGPQKRRADDAIDEVTRRLWRMGDPPASKTGEQQ
jgi:hypothetical protein